MRMRSTTAAARLVTPLLLVAVLVAVVVGFWGRDTEPSAVQRISVSDPTPLASWKGSNPYASVHLMGKSPSIEATSVDGFQVSPIEYQGFWFFIAPRGLIADIYRYALIKASPQGRIISALDLPADSVAGHCGIKLVSVNPILYQCQSATFSSIYSLDEHGRILWHANFRSQESSDVTYGYVGQVRGNDGSVRLLLWQASASGFFGNQLIVSANGVQYSVTPFRITLPYKPPALSLFHVSLLTQLANGTVMFQGEDNHWCPVVGLSSSGGKIEWIKHIANACTEDLGSDSYVDTTFSQAAAGSHLFYEFQTSHDHVLYAFSPRGALAWSSRITTSGGVLTNNVDILITGPGPSIAVASTLAGTACNPRWTNGGIGDACQLVYRWNATDGKLEGVSRMDLWYHDNGLYFHLNLVDGASENGNLMLFDDLLETNGAFAQGKWRAGLVAYSRTW